MPSHYAHYYFGKELIRILPDDIKNIINSTTDSVDAYMIGLQGPDILAFYRPYLNNALNREGRRIHHSSGSVFFETASKALQKDATPEKYSYIFGCFAHYMLDSVCHPMVSHYMKETGLTHAKIEREFDNYILKICRKSPKNLDTTPLFPPNTELGKHIAPFYLNGSPKQMTEAIASMGRYLGIMSSRNRTVRAAAYRALSLVPSENVRNKRDMIVRDKAHPDARESSIKMFNALNKTVSETAVEMDGLLDHILIGTPLSERLEPDFLGKTQ